MSICHKIAWERKEEKLVNLTTCQFVGIVNCQKKSKKKSIKKFFKKIAWDRKEEKIVEIVNLSEFVKKKLSWERKEEKYVNL